MVGRSCNYVKLDGFLPGRGDFKSSLLFLMRSVYTYYRYSVSFVLLLTAAAKLISTGANVRILEQNDPIFSIKFMHLMWGASLIETVVAFVCLLKIAEWLQAAMTALLAANFVLYRLGLWWVGYQEPCICMGRLSDGLHLSPFAADLILKSIVIYLLVGSCMKLFVLWRPGSRPVPGVRHNAPTVVY